MMKFSGYVLPWWRSAISRGQCQGIAPVSPPPTIILKFWGYQSTYIIITLGHQGFYYSKTGRLSNPLAEGFVSWHFPPKFRTDQY